MPCTLRTRSQAEPVQRRVRPGSVGAACATKATEPPHAERTLSPLSYASSSALGPQHLDALLRSCTPERRGARPAQIDLLLQTQRTYGNQAVQRMLERAPQPPSPNSPPAPAAQGCTTQPPARDPRAIFDNLCLLSSELKEDPPGRLNDAFHNNPPLTAKDNGSAVQRLQQALIDAGEVLPNFGADGKWGDETKKAVASFQGKNGIPPGSFEAGRKTLLALDARLQQNPPKPTPTPSQASIDPPQCDPGGSTMTVTGKGFPAGSTVFLLVDGTSRGAAPADPKDGSIRATVVLLGLPDGDRTLTVSGGSASATTTFKIPCSGQAPPKPDPNVVTQNELLVLTKYQFLGQTERDATEDAIKDLRTKLDPTPVPWVTTIAGVVGGMIIQFLYGSFEQIMRTAIKNTFPPQQGKTADAGVIVDNASDKASDFLEDFGQNGFKKAIEDEDQKPTKKVEEQVESFRRSYLKSLRNGYLKVETDWIESVKKDPKTADITPDELQGLAKCLDETSDKIYKNRYDATIQSWDSYIAHVKLGGKNVIVPGKGPVPDIFFVTDLSNIGDKDPKEVPGVLLIGLLGEAGSKELPDAQAEGAGFESVRPDQSDIHIFGMSEITRRELGSTHPQLIALHSPTVLRGEPKTGGLVAIGRTEAGSIVDAGSDAKGKQWLIGVGQTKKQNPSLSDPNVGAESVFTDDLIAQDIEGEIKGP